MSTILKTGSTGRRTSNKNIDNIIDSKISVINRYLETKVSKGGDEMTGDLNMDKHRITNVIDPVEDGDVINKGYCHDFVSQVGAAIISQVEEDQLKIRNDMVGIHGDAINKKYFKITSPNNIIIKRLMSICRRVNDMLSKHSEDFKSAFRREFITKHTWMQNLHLQRNRIAGGLNPQEYPPIIASVLFSRIKDLICLIISIIEEFPSKILSELRVILMRTDLLITPALGSDIDQIRIFLTSMIGLTPLDKRTENTELLFRKSQLFLELGFIYVPEELLNALVI